MRVYVESTHSPHILKFICDETLTAGSLEIGKNDPATDSLLAQELLDFPFITKVYITANFVAIQKTEMVDWEMVVEDLKEIVNRHLEQNTIILKAQEKDPYTLYVEMTPNPAVMKFVTNKLLFDGIAEAKSKEDAENIPVAKALFEFPIVKEVFVTDNYISVTKAEHANWNEWTLELRYFLLDYLQSGKEIVSKEYKPVMSQVAEILANKEYTSVEKQIKDILAEYIQPAVSGDGGNIELIEFDESTKTAKMLLQGACSGCPSSTITLKNGIETMLKEMMPGVVENVDAINA